MEVFFMFLQTAFELTLTLDSDKFTKLFDRAYGTLEHTNENTYAGYELTAKGITVLYQDSQYKKKIKIIVNPCRLLDTDKPNPEKLTRKLEKRVSGYFNNKYQLDDFDLTGMALTTDIDVHSSEKVFDYLKVLRRVGKVKGFSPSEGDWSGEDAGLCYDGNSNGIKFLLYDLEAFHGERSSDEYFETKPLSLWP
jgi:hypothetical protein